MSRIYTPQTLKEHSTLILKGDERHYIKNVLRMKTGDVLYLFNGSDREYKAEIKSIDKKQVALGLSTSEVTDKESPIQILIVQGIPKGSKMDDIIPKITELGAHRLIPLITDRSDLKTVSPNKMKRWQKIAAQSAEQTGRTQVPQISTPISLKDFLKKSGDFEKIFFYELEASQSFQDILKKSKANSFCLIVGPEGGFSKEEVALAAQHKCHMASLGKRILRTETVAPAICAILQYEKGDLNQV